MRVTHQSITTSVLSGLQGNLSRLGRTQEKLSSGREIMRPSDDPSGAVASMELRASMAASKQHVRNADDGMGWLTTVDTALNSTTTQLVRVRGLVLQGLSTGQNSSVDTREAFAIEIDGIRKSLIGVANTTYLDRPVFGGTTPGDIAVRDNGSYAGDDGTVMRTIGANTRVRVDVNAKEAFGEGDASLFKVMEDVSTALRGGDRDALEASLKRLDANASRIQSALSGVGARYNQVEQMRQTAENTSLSLTSSLSDVEGIDLPKTIMELQLQQTAYQAALAAGGRAIQPSLVDFIK